MTADYWLTAWLALLAAFIGGMLFGSLFRSHPMAICIGAAAGGLPVIYFFSPLIGL